MDIYQLIENDQDKITEFYKAGEYILKNGTPTYGEFCICSGRIELIYKNEEGFLFKEIKGPGDIIGEDNLELEDFIFDAKALVDSEVYFYDKNYIMNLKDQK